MSARQTLLAAGGLFQPVGRHYPVRGVQDVWPCSRSSKGLRLRSTLDRSCSYFPGCFSCPEFAAAVTGASGTTARSTSGATNTVAGTTRTTSGTLQAKEGRLPREGRTESRQGCSAQPEL